jgi:uncharacterized MAPEG superfamily protein
MTIAFWCVLAAGLLPYIAAFIAKSEKSFNNADPRGWLAAQQGYRRRANAAQMNGFEVFPLFAAAVLIAHWLHAPQPRLDALALGFIAARVAYLICYVANRPTLRSIAWLCGMVCVAGLFWISA